jgi:putative hydrolase of HD superfamily
MNSASKIESPDIIIDSLSQVYGLKQLARSGWIQSGIPRENVETIASHSFGMSVLILYYRNVLEAEKIDVDKALRMALIHDIGESITGDFTPEDGVSPLVKYKEESKAFEQLFRGITAGAEFRQLWEEFEAGETREAQLVRRMDKLDMLIQAFLYEKQFGIHLDSFWNDMDSLFQGSESEELFQYLFSNRFVVEG